jgi:hypothetical protein
MNISTYFLFMMISFSAANSNCMFFTQDQIAHAEGRQLPSSPKKKPAPAINTEKTTLKPRETFSYDPHSALFNPLPHHVQAGYADWKPENTLDPEIVAAQRAENAWRANNQWQISSKGKKRKSLGSSQEKTD